ncbi:hypothetical protein C6P45_001968 [Maudiozyma exigua]|uniref:C2H2-type domain-containing protein n=1 Tax=Maudiozyma exigua TaxID=34358 RepID=A0A9P6WFN4_MAUEX|nr:hypothetical protein C6P45_001968 [Kazachstania exigua]
MSFGLQRSTSNYTMNYISQNITNNNNYNSMNNSTNGYNFNLQLIQKDDNNKPVNNDLTGNTLTEDTAPQFNINTNTNTNININNNNGRRLSISDYNFDNANYYEYEDFEMNLQLNNANNDEIPILIDSNNNESRNVDTSKQLPLTHHEIDLENDLTLEDSDTDIDMMMDDNDDDIEQNNTTNSNIAFQGNNSSRRRMRDYFKFNLFNSTNQPKVTNESEILLKSEGKDTTILPQFNDQFNLKKKSSFWNPKTSSFLKRYNSKNKDGINNTNIPDVDDVSTRDFELPDLFDIENPLVQDSSSSSLLLPIQAVEPIFKNTVNQMVTMNQVTTQQQQSQINSTTTNTTMSSLVSLSSPVMTIAPSLVTTDDISNNFVEPIKSMNPFEQDINLNYFDINANNAFNDNTVEEEPLELVIEEQPLVENETPRKVTPTTPAPSLTPQQQPIKRRGSNTLPKTRGRKPSLIPDASKQFCCDYCDRRFKRQEHLKRHIRSLHICEKPFTCHICQKNFSRSDNLNQHIKTHSHDETN